MTPSLDEGMHRVMVIPTFRLENVITIILEFALSLCPSAHFTRHSGISSPLRFSNCLFPEHPQCSGLESGIWNLLPPYSHPSRQSCESGIWNLESGICPRGGLWESGIWNLPSWKLPSANLRIWNLGNWKIGLSSRVFEVRPQNILEGFG